MKSHVIVGLMSGTSLDGVSCAAVRFCGDIEQELHFELLGFTSREYSREQRDVLARALSGDSPEGYCRLGFDLGEWFADAVVATIAEAGIAKSDITAIASHGQTVWHVPGHSTWQIGESAIIAERTGIDVISDFRVRDVAAGGQGAPLVPIADALLFASRDRWRSLQNLGGIGNVTIMVPGGMGGVFRLHSAAPTETARRAGFGVSESPETRRGSGASARGQQAKKHPPYPLYRDLTSVRAFDTGPGVVIVDGVTRALRPDLVFDVDGQLALAGKPVMQVVEQKLRHPFFSEEPPKSTGRELFTRDYIQSFIYDCRVAGAKCDEDIIATAVEFTARSIAVAFERFVAEPVAELVLSGGGAKNPALVKAITAALSDIKVQKFDDLYFDSEAKEAVAFALLGLLHVMNIPGNVPSATGARGPRILGKLTPA